MALTSVLAELHQYLVAAQQLLSQPPQTQQHKCFKHVAFRLVVQLVVGVSCTALLWLCSIWIKSRITWIYINDMLTKVLTKWASNESNDHLHSAMSSASIRNIRHRYLSNIIFSCWIWKPSHVDRMPSRTLIIRNSSCGIASKVIFSTFHFDNLVSYNVYFLKFEYFL